LPQIHIDQVYVVLAALFFSFGKYKPDKVIPLNMHIAKGAANEYTNFFPSLRHWYRILLNQQTSACLFLYPLNNIGMDSADLHHKDLPQTLLQPPCIHGITPLERKIQEPFSIHLWGKGGTQVKMKKLFDQEISIFTDDGLSSFNKESRSRRAYF
jgi:hypothetical protein